jgi:glutathione S-transferase
MKLYIGNKNYSSWSMRPWLALRAAGIAFEEEVLWFDATLGKTTGDAGSFRAQVAALSSAQTVPVLEVAPDLRVVDSLAIIEYAAEAHPQAPVWPRDARLRAHARSACAQMHAGFGAIRQNFPMNIEALLPEVGQRVLAERADVRAQVARMQALWSELFDRSGGPYLGGAAFTAVDAYFAPVCMRFVTYGVPLSDVASAYVARVRAHEVVGQWVAAALAEARFVPEDEPYRTSR